MSNAPETIWARVYNHSFPFGGGVYWDCEKRGKYQKYRRADLPLTTDQLMADPRVKALVDAARRASHATTNDGITGRIYTDEAIALQRALAQLKETTNDGN